MKKSVIGLSFIVAVSAGFVFGGDADPAKLVGTKKCAMCHKKAETGDQYGVWKSKNHANAYAMLAGEEAKAVATKLGIEDPQTSGQCLKCHSTAYFFTDTLQSEKVAVEDGVSCESCHGPGADYKKKSVMQSHEESIAAGMVYPALEKSCTKCHNDTGPTWNPERYTLPDGTKTGFDAKQAYDKIKHDRPAAAAGE
ncbi:MAG: cytochrome c family protein [Desulfobulbaceae bacterium]|nr:cytochrome c family protein [Desulfobulbaceae bacterium]